MRMPLRLISEGMDHFLQTDFRILLSAIRARKLNIREQIDLLAATSGSPPALSPHLDSKAALIYGECSLRHFLAVNNDKDTVTQGRAGVP